MPDGPMLTRLFLVSSILCCALYSQQPPSAQNLANASLDVIPVQGNIYMMVGPGGNITVQAGKDGVLLVDAMFAETVPKVAAEIKKLSDKPIRYIIDTHMHRDHTGGNEGLQKIGVAGASPVEGGGATLIAHANVLNRMTEPLAGSEAPPIQKGLPNDEYSTPTKDLFFNGEAVVIFHQPKAHTDGDSIVFFRRSDVLSVGDIFTPDKYPVIDIAHGGTINGLIDGLNHILHLTVPEHLQEGGTKVIPGHGRLCDEADVVEYRDMATIIRDRIQDAMKKGQTLDRIKAAKLTRDYDPQYGSGDAFVEAVYRSLSGATR
jgi:cyclase